MLWGDRMGLVKCPFGYRCTLATRLKEPSPAEIEAGVKAMTEQMDGQ
jgi:hypothetical protein